MRIPIVSTLSVIFFFLPTGHDFEMPHNKIAYIIFSSQFYYMETIDYRGSTICYNYFLCR